MMKPMSEFQKEDPPCPYDKPCHIWHHETIQQGIPCPCKCHYSKKRYQDWGDGLNRILNKDEVIDYLTSPGEKS